MANHVKRAAFLAGAAAAAASFAPARAAQTQLGPPTPMGVPTRAFVQHPQLIRQQCPQWCWAASSAMIFAAYGHPVAQQTIVDRVFNATVCAPSGNTSNIGGVLSDQWTDQNGLSFRSRVVAAYDSMNGINAIDNAIIVQELAANRPLLYCNTHHAMVVVSCDFLMGPMGPTQVAAVGVLDPWPGSPGYHLLTPPEMVPAHLGGQMTFLATVRTT